MARTKRIAEEPQEQSTALALPDTDVLIAAFSDAGKMEAILSRIEQEVTSVAPDLSTATSRKAIASTAYKVARSKTALDEVGKTVTEDARKHIDNVNATRRNVRDRLENLQRDVRKPLDEWEAAEAARVAKLEDRLRDFTNDLPTSDDNSADIAYVLQEIDAIPVDATWAEFKDRATAAKAAALDTLKGALNKARAREAERAELERLRAEMAVREAAEQRRLAEERQAAEAARIECEKAEAAERAAQAERGRAERESREREERHQREIAAAEARRERELAEAAERERMAAQRERDRIVAEQERADAERRAREADQARQERVAKAIYDALVLEGIPPDYATWAAGAIRAGRIPHVKVEM